MFDLWGETTPLPMPSLDLPTADISVKEKLAWERELMGVYLSEHPFSSFAAKLAPENATLCGQIDVELVGQTVVVAGMVSSVNHLFTRDRRSFASVVLEDIDGRVEVMVWPQVYNSTKELWEEGNILVVAGKVRMRDDQVQLNCDSVQRYQPEVSTPEPDEAPVVAEETPEIPETPAAAPPKRHRLVISITQTSDEDSDITRLQKLIGNLKDFPGRDEVTLCIKIEDRVDNLKLPSTGYCSELHQRLVELVGEDGLRLEPLAP
jgi:DNA polymerase-3 subunit alpha